MNFKHLTFSKFTKFILTQLRVINTMSPPKKTQTIVEELKIFIPKFTLIGHFSISIAH